ncbi:MAG: dockerin type I repeat-containing protein [Clostridia bacterium]|nr:dockerin type I repeat-containing protein [Clostridia bacterium]
MKNIPKIIAFALAAILALAPAAAFAKAAPGQERGRGAGELFPGSGAEDDPFLISTADELAQLAALVNGGDECEGFCFALTEDIVLNDTADFENWSENNRPENFWHPIGGGAYSFRGCFDGRGHTVSGMFACATNGTKLGLFGSAENAVIRDLSVIRSCVLGNSVAVGGIIGAAEGMFITGCEFEGTVTGTRSVGGICGSTGSCCITDCSAQANISAFQYAGGIVGLAGTTSFSGCGASGTIDANDRAGGMIGYALVGCSAADCRNGAAITCDEYAGGIVGIGQNTELSYCENLADIASERYTGGIFGFCCGASADSCANRGDISGDYYIGGIVGWCDDGADFGSSGLYNYVLRCMNTGAVSGNWGIGGLAGDAHDTDFTDSFNFGPVTSVEYAGGLIGYTADCGVLRCYNAGSVAAGTGCGALVGANSMNGTSFENCVYLNTSCAAGDPHGTARTEEQLLLAESYPGFDFGSVWELAGTGYPFARLRLGAILPPIPLCGDADGSGSVTVTDAVTVLRFAMSLAEPTPLQLFRSDTDGDGSVTVSDAITILRIAMGLR